MQLTGNWAKAYADLIWHVQVWVANHSSIIDYAVLSAATPFACIMQLQPGFLGFLQTRVLPCVGGLFFNRTEARMLLFNGSMHAF